MVTMAQADVVLPSLETVQELLSQPSPPSSKKPNIVPLYGQISADLITPSAAYLKVSAHSKSDFSFLYESAATERVGRYSFVGAGPRKIITTGEGYGESTDPLPALEKELAERVVAHVPDLRLPPLTGGAIGYVGYDCVRYFEPKTARPMKDVLKIPESLFMLFDTIVAFDSFFGVVKVITYLNIPDDLASLSAEYEKATAIIHELIDVLTAPEIPIPEQQPIKQGQEYTSNIGRAGVSHAQPPCTLSTYIATCAP
ncbi:hypothetical protein NUW58_g9050 [Xylaria curta]|uniref:Uncharacterized protein n=1 Tax=Xylaria curta TaxID=42375 RepID=A0ACC1N181_9PEZI|nr:hypothetical protein NUW58_g9050 [Xylaria curta]